MTDLHSLYVDDGTPVSPHRRRLLKKRNRATIRHFARKEKRTRDRHDLMMSLVRYFDNLTPREIVSIIEGSKRL